MQLNAPRLRFGTVFNIITEYRNPAESSQKARWEQRKTFAAELIKNLQASGVSEARLGLKDYEVKVVTNTHPGQDAFMDAERFALEKTLKDSEDFLSGYSARTVKDYEAREERVKQAKDLVNQLLDRPGVYRGRAQKQEHRDALISAVNRFMVWLQDSIIQNPEVQIEIDEEYHI